MSTRSNEASTAITFGPEAQGSAAVTVSATTSFNDLPRLVSALMSIGVPATVTLRGTQEDVKSAIASLNSNAIIFSAALSIGPNSVAVSLRGDKPVGS